MKEESSTQERRGVSWATMLALIVLGFLVAGGIAYRLVTPFFHSR